MKHYGDASKIEGSQVEPVDIITFGSPCQDLSVAGKRAGILNGITPVWASEVEPYPIAVTVSRFGKTGGAIKK